MRVTNRQTGEQLADFEIGLSLPDLEELLPWLQGRLEEMRALGRHAGETVIGSTDDAGLAHQQAEPS